MPKATQAENELSPVGHEYQKGVRAGKEVGPIGHENLLIAVLREL